MALAMRAEDSSMPPSSRLLFGGSGLARRLPLRHQLEHVLDARSLRVVIARRVKLAGWAALGDNLHLDDAALDQKRGALAPRSMHAESKVGAATRVTGAHRGATAQVVWEETPLLRANQSDAEGVSQVGLRLGNERDRVGGGMDGRWEAFYGRVDGLGEAVGDGMDGVRKVGGRSRPIAPGSRRRSR